MKNMNQVKMARLSLNAPYCPLIPTHVCAYTSFPPQLSRAWNCGQSRGLGGQTSRSLIPTVTLSLSIFQFPRLLSEGVGLSLAPHLECSLAIRP